MAKFVIAGKSDCPFYARVELLADELQQRLADFSVHKITLTPEDWKTWVDTTCKERGWIYNGESPIVWRELINRGGKGVLIGSSNEFLEIAMGYYGLTMDKTTADLELISKENKKSKFYFDLQEEKRVKCSNLYKITVTDSHTAMAYNLLPHLCTGNLSKDTKNISLTLFSSCMDEEMENLNAISMELIDCANSELKNVSLEKDVTKAFVDAELVVILNNNKINAESVTLLKQYGTALNKAKSNVKIIVAGVQPMIACYFITQTADKVEKERFYALSRLQENQAKAFIAKKLSVNTPDISNVIIWGSSLEFILNHTNATAAHYDGAVWAPHIEIFLHTVNEIVYDKEWLATELPMILEGEGCNINVNGSEGMRSQQNLSHTAALISQIGDILNGSQSKLFSLGLVSNGCYGIPEGLVFSVPCLFRYGKIIANENIALDDDMRSRISSIADKLKQYCNELVQT